MRKDRAALLLCLVASTLVGACRIFTPAGDLAATRTAVVQETHAARVTEIAAVVYATQTAEAPTPSPTSTNTPSPTTTPTTTPTATSTATSTATPTTTGTAKPASSPTVVPPPDWSGVVLTAEDLPDGFQAVPPEESGIALGTHSGVGSALIETAFVFVNPVHGEGVWGYAIILPDRAQEYQLDLQLDAHVRALLMSVAGGRAGRFVRELEGLAGLQIGDVSAGMAADVPDEHGNILHAQAIVFRRGPVGVFLSVTCSTDDTPSVSIGELARTLDDRVVAALAIDGKHEERSETTVL